MKVADQIRAVFDHWRMYHSQACPRPSGESKEWKKIRDRLGEGYTVAQLCRAIDGMHKSPFHLGENDRGTKYLKLELCMRDAGHVEQFLEVIADHEKRAPVLSEKTKRTLRAVDSWAERGQAERQPAIEHQPVGYIERSA